jgi:acid phosphatase type 7
MKYNTTKINILIVCLILLLSIFFNNCSDSMIFKSDEDWSFVAYGDLRQGFGIYSKIAVNVSLLDPVPVFAVCTGDIMNQPGNEVQWENFFRYSQPITKKMPMYIARGNHEGNSELDEYVFSDQTGMHNNIFYQSFEYFDSFFIILDTEIRNEEGSIKGAQLDWLTAQLNYAEYASNIKHIFIFMHRPLYPQGAHKGENLHNAHELHAIFNDLNKLRAVIASHDHSFYIYQRDNVTYITSGGAGAPLHDSEGAYYHYLKISVYTDEQRINIKTLGIFNETIADFDL